MAAEHLSVSDIDEIVKHLSVLDSFLCRAGSPYSKCSIEEIMFSIEMHEDIEDLIDKLLM